jgi:hypothetical protein
MSAVPRIGPIHATVLALAISATAAIAQTPRVEWSNFGGDPTVNIFRRALASATLEFVSDGPATRTPGELFAGPLVDDDPQMPWWGPSLGQTLAPFLEIVTAVLEVRPTILPTTGQFPFDHLESILVQAVTHSDPIEEKHAPAPTDAARNETTDHVEVAPEPRREHAGDTPTTATPEPASMMLVATGLATMGASVIRRRRRKS